jgi:hypothetical protein
MSTNAGGGGGGELNFGDLTLYLIYDINAQRDRPSILERHQNTESFWFRCDMFHNF